MPSVLLREISDANYWSKLLDSGGQVLPTMEPRSKTNHEWRKWFLFQAWHSLTKLCNLPANGAATWRPCTIWVAWPGSNSQETHNLSFEQYLLSWRMTSLYSSNHNLQRFFHILVPVFLTHRHVDLHCRILGKIHVLSVKIVHTSCRRGEAYTPTTTSYYEWMQYDDAGNGHVSMLRHVHDQQV